MGIYLCIGNKKSNGFVNAIFARRDGGLDEAKLFYKYYRTPKRVNALVKSGSTRSALGIYISDEELNNNSPLYNEEVTMLPLYIGQGEEDSIISFADKSFYKNKHYSDLDYKDPVGTFSYENVESFYDTAKKDEFLSDCVYLYDSDTREWYRGFERKPLKDAILEDYERMSKDNYDTQEEIDTNREKLIKYMEEIEQYIKGRENNRPVFVDSNTGEMAIVQDNRLLMKYQDLVMYAKSIGLIIDGCSISKEMENTTPKRTI